MKKLIALALIAGTMLTMAACGSAGNASNETTTAAPNSNPTTPAGAEELSMGMGVVVSTASSADNNAQVDATVAAVVLDADGKIVKVQIDCAQSKLAISETGTVDTATTFQTKAEKKEAYGMGSIATAGEWYVQVDALEKVLVGKTLADMKALTTVVNEGGHNVATDADVYAACTMDVSDFYAAVIKACETATSIGTADASKVTLGVSAVTTAGDSTNAAVADDGTVTNGTAAIYSHFGAVAMVDGKVVGALVDAIQPKISFTETGAIAGATYTDTKKGLKEGYGMSAIGAVEWYKQVAAFEAYVDGMTAAQVGAIATTTNDHGYVVAADADLYAGCTIQITDFIEVLVKATAVVG